MSTHRATANWRHWITTLGLSTAAALGGGVVSCGAETTTGDSSAASLGADEPGGTGEQIIHVSSLALIPDISTLFSSSDAATALHLAVSGTPPVFSEIKANSLETYLSPNVPNMISDVSRALEQGDWDQVQAQIDSFRQAQNKCEAMQSVARQVQSLMQATGSLCYMGNISRSETELLQYVSGEELADQASFFAQGDADRTHALEIDGPMGQERIVFSIPGTASRSDGYEIKLTFCNRETGTARSVDHIVVDNTLGTFTYSTGHAEEGEHGTDQWIALISAALQESGDSFKFNPDAARTMTAWANHRGGGNSYQANTELTLNGGQLTSREISEMQSTLGNQTFSHNSKNILAARFSGSSAANLRVFEGAGKRIATWSNGSETNSHTGSIAFEHQELANPRYATVTSSTYLDTINSESTASGLLAQTTPTAPDLSLIDSSVCELTPDSVYSLDMTSAAMGAIQSQCENSFDDHGSTCDALRDQEHSIWEAVHRADQRD